MDDERLKRGTYLTEKYFDEQLERIREIRASERKFYQKITELLIMIKILQQREDSMRLFRIKCITQFMDIRRLN